MTIKRNSARRCRACGAVYAESVEVQLRGDGEAVGLFRLEQVRSVKLLI